MSLNKLDYEIFNFGDSGNGKSWLIGTDIWTGTDVSQWANAYRNGINGCPENLEVPGTLTDINGQNKSVEIIGRGAFAACGLKGYGKTISVKVPRQVKVIKHCGFSDMNDVLHFELELGNELETIESYGLSQIGLTGIGDRSTLILPPTVTSIYPNGIYRCNHFNVIIYCGTHLLSNSTELETLSPQTVVRVTNQYPGQKILGRTPVVNSESEDKIICDIDPILPPSLSPSPSSSPSPSPTHNPIAAPSPSPSPTTASSPIVTPSPVLIPDPKPSLTREQIIGIVVGISLAILILIIIILLCIWKRYCQRKTISNELSSDL